MNKINEKDQQDRRGKNLRAIAFTYDGHNVSPGGLKYEVCAYFDNYLYQPGLIVGS